MTYKELKLFIHNELNDIFGEREKSSIVQILLEHLTNFNKIQFMLSESEECPDIVIEEAEIAIQRLKNFEPIQYITNSSFFIDFELFVDSSVLIPRPETEELVRWIAKEHDGSKHVLDIGTGSACIPIGLQYFNPEFIIEACDISDKALVVAKMNAEKFNFNINFFKLNILTNKQLFLKEYDIIISNPPYIPPEEKKVMHQNVLDFEPHIALFSSNENPLEFYKAICEFSQVNLAKDGFLYFEMNEFYAIEIQDIMESFGFTNIEMKRDLQGKWRMIRAQKN